MIIYYKPHEICVTIPIHKLYINPIYWGWFEMVKIIHYNVLSSPVQHFFSHQLDHFFWPITHRHKKRKNCYYDGHSMSHHELNNNECTLGRANINHWLSFLFFSHGSVTVNPGCRSPCRTPTGWCRSEAGHAGPGWSRETCLVYFCWVVSTISDQINFDV